MQLSNLIEMVKEFHPDRSGPVISYMLNDALAEFCGKTRVYRKTVQIQRSADGITFTLPTDWLATKKVRYDADATEEVSNFTAVSQIAYNGRVPRAVGYDAVALQTYSDGPVWVPIHESDSLLIGNLEDGLFTEKTPGQFALTYEARDTMDLTDASATPNIPSQFHGALAHRVIETFYDKEEQVRQRSYHYARWDATVKDAIRQRNEDGLADGWGIVQHEI